MVTLRELAEADPADPVMAPSFAIVAEAMEQALPKLLDQLRRVDQLRRAAERAVEQARAGNCTAREIDLVPEVSIGPLEIPLRRVELVTIGPWHGPAPPARAPMTSVAGSCAA
jgi:hypothetical protein